MVFSPAHPLVGIGGALAIVDSLCLVPFFLFVFGVSAVLVVCVE